MRGLLTAWVVAWGEYEYRLDNLRRLPTRRYRYRPKYVSQAMIEWTELNRIFTVRTTRARIIHLRNDHKDVMNRLEKGLHEHFANLQQAQTQAAAGVTDASSSASQVALADATSTSPAGIVETPFAKVNSVVSGSPAEQAGLKAGDTIRNFGGANWMNHERLSKVAQIVQQHEGVSF